MLLYEMKKISSPAPQKHNRVNIVSKRKIKLILINKDKGKRIKTVENETHQREKERHPVIKFYEADKN